MTRKDYVIIAHELGHARIKAGSQNELGGFWRAVDAVVEALKADNPRFDAKRFYEAVGGGKKARQWDTSKDLTTNAAINSVS